MSTVLRLIDSFLGSSWARAGAGGWLLWHVSPDMGTFVAALIVWNATSVQIDQIHERSGGFRPEKCAEDERNGQPWDGDVEC